jgi:hypothetical protein
MTLLEKISSKNVRTQTKEVGKRIASEIDSGKKKLGDFTNGEIFAYNKYMSRGYGAQVPKVSDPERRAEAMRYGKDHGLFAGWARDNRNEPGMVGRFGT